MDFNVPLFRKMESEILRFRNFSLVLAAASVCSGGRQVLFGA